VDAVSTDGKVHSIQLYADIEAGASLLYEGDNRSSCIADWVSNGTTAAIEWDSKQTTNAAYLQVRPSKPTSTFVDIAEDSLIFHAIDIVSIL
jgi:hypothetical protein